jgi:hypothetical protein
MYAFTRAFLDSVRNTKKNSTEICGIPRLVKLVILYYHTPDALRGNHGIHPPLVDYLPVGTHSGDLEEFPGIREKSSPHWNAW